jgi:AhpD family alkylhydroperoxidase
MEPRLTLAKATPTVLQGMLGLQDAIDKCGLEHSLMELVKMRASQINGCAHCLAMHARDARKAGEREERLHLLPAWHEAPGLYSERERAALAWTEALTLVAQDHVPDATYQKVRPLFSDRELADLSFAIVAINGWNRMAVALRLPPQLDPPARQAA